MSGLCGKDLNSDHDHLAVHSDSSVDASIQCNLIPGMPSELLNACSCIKKHSKDHDRDLIDVNLPKTK